ncbi:hypothetical protein Slin15195_G107140 [Septoria linicola]|uniref:Uncharacterized protein n=1 Tax=Septoria linicola TaxID=215465 RepID=A0A9Q9AYD5_9PEZI|nr:hypothetical protein Slin15195_G107140 [Septoria linicola]
MGIKRCGAHHDVATSTIELDSRMAKGARDGSKHEGTVETKMDDSELFCALSICEDFRRLTMWKQYPKAKVNERYFYKGHAYANVLYATEPAIRTLSKHAIPGFPRFDIRGFITDWFTRSLSQITSNVVKMPTQVIPQCQIYLDVIDAMGHQAELGHTLMQASIHSMSSSLDAFAQASRITTNGHKASDGLAELSTRMRSTAEGQLSSLFDNATEAEEPSELYEALPLLAGHQLHKFQVENQRCLLGYANGDPWVLCVAYLYRAARKAGLCEIQWSDMDTVMSSQDAHGAYVRDGDCLERYAKHFDGAVGVPASAFARKGISRPQVPSASTGMQKMKKLRPASSYMSVADEIDQWPDLDTSIRADYYAKLHRIAKVIQNGPQHRVAQTAPELLESLEKCLARDEVHLRFDLAKFLTQCEALKVLVIAQAQSDAAFMSGKSGFYLHQVVHEVLWVAAAADARGTLAQSMLAEIGAKISALADTKL